MASSDAAVACVLRAVVIGEFMKRHGLLVVLCLGCGGDTAPSEEISGLFECVELPRPDCSEPLPPSDEDRAPWPTYAEATRELADCSQREGGCWQRRQGTCSDGKTFTSWSGGFTGDSYYFEGETLVGVWRWSDILICENGLACYGSGLGDPSCDETAGEDLTCPCL
jgi:hypothetical protein